MLKTIETLVQRPNNYKIIFEYKNVYNNVLVSCIIRDEYYTHKPKYRVFGLASNEIEAFELALKTLNRIKEFGNIEWPDLDRQKYEGGYYRKMIAENIEVEFMRIRDEFFVTQIREKDDDFYVVEQPFVLPEHYKFIEKTKDGDLYQWSELGYLCGSAGKAIVKDGMVIKKKTELIS